MNGSPQFIEVTDAQGVPRIVSLRCICFIKEGADGRAVIELTNNTLHFVCRESYEQVRLALIHNQPPPETYR